MPAVSPRKNASSYRLLYKNLLLRLRAVAYARDLKYRANGSYLILHKYGAVYDTANGWKTTTPPYYPGTDYARGLQLKSGETNYVILHKDGALWSTDGGWVMTTPPYYPGTDYARGLEQVGRT